jgi:hypothetical protein
MRIQHQRVRSSAVADGLLPVEELPDHEPYVSDMRQHGPCEGGQRSVSVDSCVSSRLPLQRIDP